MTASTGGVALERSRSGWDIVWGILLVIAGFLLLGAPVVATAASVFFIGWMTLISGAIALIAGLFRIGKGGFWPAVISGSILLVLGLVILRNPAASAVTLTLLAGTLFLTSGVLRIVAAFQVDQNRWIMIFSGAVSLVLGLMVVLNLFTASLVLLGVLIGVQAVVDGIALLVLGRWRLVDKTVVATDA